MSGAAPMQRMTGIRELADHLDISIGTVSRALNDKPDVNAKTRERVIKAARELGYVPSQAGRSLRKGSSNIIGLVIEADPESESQGDLFFNRVMAGMQSVLATGDFNVVALISPSDEERVDYLRRIVARRFTDAIVLSSTRQHDPRISLLAESGVPFITLGRSQTDGGQPWLDLDFEWMTRDAMSRLVALGHERIGIVVHKSDINLVKIVIDTYRDALQQHSLEFDPSLVFRATDNGRVIAYELAQLNNPPTAVVFSAEMFAFGLYRGLHELGIQPGKDLSILGMGARLSDTLTPRLSHYRVSLFDLGRRLAEVVLSTVTSRRTDQNGHIVRERAPIQYVEGDTVCPPNAIAPRMPPSN